jgi:hypothetical protein
MGLITTIPLRMIMDNGTGMLEMVQSIISDLEVGEKGAVGVVEGATLMVNPDPMAPTLLVRKEKSYQMFDIEIFYKVMRLTLQTVWRNPTSWEMLEVS